MEIDLAQLDSSADGSDLLRAETCIIGGGIAGLTLAHRLVALGHDVMLLEAGDSTDRDRLPLDEVVQAGYPHPGTMEPRAHALGGASLVWGGQLLPMPSDAGWPVSAEELARYTRQAEQLLGVDDLAYDGEDFYRNRKKPVPALLNQLPDVTLQLSKFAPFSHRNLAHTIGLELRKNSRGRIVVHAKATELILSSSRDRVEAVMVRSSSGRMFRVQAKQIVVAAGTIETVRLLLASRSVAAEGIGNAHDQVGRNFHDHLTVPAATLSGDARRQLLALRPWVHRGTSHAFKLCASAQLCGRLNLNPVLAHLTIEEPANDGIAAIRSILRARQEGHTAESIRRALPELPRAIRDGALLALSAETQHRRYISPRANVQLRLNVAQRSLRGSRITLSQNCGPILDWKIDESELETFQRFAQYLRERLTMKGVDWNESLFKSPSAISEVDDARHAMGGACMGTDPRTSVVDTDLLVHGLSNLFIASAAVFPDGSPQLPTLPLMQLTLRLANHLRHCP